MYDAGFWPRHGRGGKELFVDRQFVWGGETWHIPAVYLCVGGLVIDSCVKIDPERIRAYTDKWELALSEERSYIEVERLSILMSILIWVKPCNIFCPFHNFIGFYVLDYPVDYDKTAAQPQAAPPLH